MKTVARMMICLTLVLSIASWDMAQGRKTVSEKTINDILRQLFSDCKAEAPSPDSWNDIKIEGPAADYIDVDSVSLSPGRITYLIAGKREPFYGAHAEMYWIYEKTATGYRQLDSLGANYGVRPLPTSHNGFRDLATTYVSGAGTVLDSCRLIFNGKHYVSAGCNRKRLRR